MKYFLLISILLCLYISCVLSACTNCNNDQWCTSCATSSCSNGALGNTCCSHDDCGGTSCCDTCTKKCTATLANCETGRQCTSSSTTKTATTSATSTTKAASSSTTGSSTGTTHTGVYITSYGWNDNDDGVNFGNDVIAYTNVKHGHAVETDGSYDNPCTFATDQRFLKPGTIIYVPHVKKYYIMEDGCVSCGRDWDNGKKHVDLWIGPNAQSNQDQLYACENAITRSSATIIVNPASNLQVVTKKIFINGVCSPPA